MQPVRLPLGAAHQAPQAVPVVPVAAVGQAEGGMMAIIVPGTGIWQPIEVSVHHTGQVELLQLRGDVKDSDDSIILDPADLDALIAALQAVKEQANGQV